MKKPVTLDDETVDQLREEVARQHPLSGFSDRDRAAINLTCWDCDGAGCNVCGWNGRFFCFDARFVS